MSSEARHKAWVTRRASYGECGHSGPYNQWPRQKPDTAEMLRLIIRLHNEGVLSEGQVVKTTGLDRVDVRRLAQDSATNEEGSHE